VNDRSRWACYQRCSLEDQAAWSWSGTRSRSSALSPRVSGSDRGHATLVLCEEPTPSLWVVRIDSLSRGGKRFKPCVSTRRTPWRRMTLFMTVRRYDVFGYISYLRSQRPVQTFLRLPLANRGGDRPVRRRLSGCWTRGWKRLASSFGSADRWRAISSKIACSFIGFIGEVLLWQMDGDHGYLALRPCAGFQGDCESVSLALWEIYRLVLAVGGRGRKTSLSESGARLVPWCTAQTARRLFAHIPPRQQTRGPVGWVRAGSKDMVLFLEGWLGDTAHASDRGCWSGFRGSAWMPIVASSARHGDSSAEIAYAAPAWSVNAVRDSTLSCRGFVKWTELPECWLFLYGVSAHDGVSVFGGLACIWRAEIPLCSVVNSLHFACERGAYGGSELALKGKAAEGPREPSGGEDHTRGDYVEGDGRFAFKSRGGQQSHPTRFSLARARGNLAQLARQP